MRSTIHIAAAAQQSAAQHSLKVADASPGAFASAAAALYDIWAEAAVVALILYIYFGLMRSSPSILKRFTAPRKFPKGVRIVPCKPKAGSIPEKSPSESKSSPKADGRADVQAFIESVLQKSWSSAKEPLQQYEIFVRAQRVDMRHQFANDQSARIFYSILIECGIQAVAERGDRSCGEALSARESTTRLLADMRLFSFSRSHDFYSAILKVHTVGRLFADSMWLVDVMVADGVTLDRTMLGYLVSVAVACGQDQKAISFFKEISRMGRAPMRTYMTILRVYSKHSDWWGAVEVLDSLKACDASPDALVLNTVLGLCVSKGEVRVAENLLAQWADSADVVSSNIVLKGYAQQSSLASAEALLKRMLQNGPAPNMITFNTMMDCAVRSLQHVQATEQHSRGAGGGSEGRLAYIAAASQRQWQLLDMLVELGLQPDRYTCSTLVKGLHLTGCSVHDIDRAVALVRSIGPAGLHAAGTTSGHSSEATNARLQEVLFNTLLDACVSIQDLDRLAEIFKLMREFKVEVSSVTFGTLIKAFGQAGQLGHCHEVWRNMLDANVRPTVVTFGCYIDTCIRNADMASAEAVFRSMPAMAVKPNAVIYTSMIRGYANAKKPSQALQLYKEMQQGGVEVTAATGNSVLDALVRQLADPAHLQQVVDDMRKASILPDVVTYSLLIKASCNAGQMDNALQFFRELRRHGLAFDEMGFNTLLLACSKAEQVPGAEEVLGEMRAIGMAPTQATISILVKMYGKARMLDKAIDLSNSVEREYGMKPNLHVYTCLIQACVRNKQLRKSWELFGRMLCADILPDAITYGSVIQGCVYNNKFDQAMALVRHAYALDDPSGHCILQVLGLGSGVSSPRRGHPAPLQTDVLKALQTGLKRKELYALAAELQTIIEEHGMARLSTGR